ncbi:hypothetical protein ID0440_10970 [Helicobacter pylori]
MKSVRLLRFLAHFCYLKPPTTNAKQKTDDEHPNAQITQKTQKTQNTKAHKQKSGFTQKRNS